MRTRTLTAFTASAATIAATLLAAPSMASASPERPASTAVDHKVIVILKSQPAAKRVGTNAARTRAAAVAAVQAPLVDAARSAGSTHVKRYTLINAFGATVSAAEEAALKSDSRVAKVIPDSTIRESRSQTSAGSTKQAAASLSLHAIPGACAPNGKSQLDPEGLSSIHAASDDPKAKTAASLGFTGKGVKVAYIAEGIDIHNVNFLRNPSDPASTVFSDYKDFSGDGPNAATTGGEAFLDANAIAGQGEHVYSTRHYSAQNASSDCNVRIQGTAPGVSLVGLKVFAENATTTESAFLQAIDYAVETAHVAVLNESFGSNNFPDVTSVDATNAANEAAVAAGVTVTASSGDAGPTSTIGSPASDPKVISLGASTNFRYYAQTNYASARYVATKGWLDDNPSGLSSSGFTSNAQTINLLAPGDLSWASCTASATYEDCTNYLGKASDIESSGGTSESAPLTAGVVALVIQAYAKAHDGAKPSPALIKNLLTSTATDLGGPSSEQGSGLVNAYRAVRAAQSVTPQAGYHRHGSTLLKSVDALHSVDSAGTTEHYSVTVTNDGESTQSYSAAGRTLGADTGVQTGSVTLSDASSSKIPNQSGGTTNIEKFRFTVPTGQQRLDASIAYKGDPTTGDARARLLLVDPTGHYAGHSIPQGIGNHGDSIVYKPSAGTWTGYVTAIAGTVQGKVLWRTATEKNTSFGSVSPSAFTLAPGFSRTVKVTAKTPTSAGDRASAVVFTAKGGDTTTIPVTQRSTVDVGAGGTFSGTLTGGNGRPYGPGQTEFYRFKVGAGTKDITANIKLSKNAANVIGLYLVSPDGNAQGYGQNTISGTATETKAAVPTISASAFAANPASGVWTLVVDFAQPVSGDLISQKFTGNIVLNAARAKATGLPTSSKTVLEAGVKVNVPVRIANTSGSPISAFVDARLKTGTTLQLADLSGQSQYALPLTPDKNGNVAQPVYFVPTQTRSIRVAQTSSVASEFDVFAAAGSPDLASSTSCSTSPSLSYAPSGARIANGIWAEIPAECGPYAGAAPKGTASVSTTVSTKAFDPAVTSARGDVELTATDPGAGLSVDPLLIGRGKSGTINVSITPKGKAGTVVSGYLFVDTLVDDVPPYGQFASDELVRIPYSYTIG